MQITIAQMAKNDMNHTGHELLYGCIGLRDKLGIAGHRYGNIMLDTGTQRPRGQANALAQMPQGCTLGTALGNYGILYHPLLDGLTQHLLTAGAGVLLAFTIR